MPLLIYFPFIVWSGIVTHMLELQAKHARPKR
jgi:hypothetical protein